MWGLVRADTASDLQIKINDTNTAITGIENEIKAYQAQIDVLGQQSSSLKNTIATLDISKKKLEANLSLTTKKIAATNLEIKQLESDIGNKQSSIEGDRGIMSNTLSLIAEKDTQSLLELMLSSESLASAWNYVDNLSLLEGSVKSHIGTLAVAKTGLETNKKVTEKKKSQLVSLNNDLARERKLIIDTTNEKNSLLAQTKDTEANYRKLLADKVAKKLAFEQEISQYQNALHLSVDAKSLPTTGSGVLHYPLEHIIITQYFGDTDFSTKNPQIYSGHGHTGIDFGASIGTPVLAALDGTVVGTGNTDLISGCYSYGKWVMIRHANGLSTLYAHLSLPFVTSGQSVTTGQVIGYSGATGYATGPHLHFGVYATQGVRITTFTNSKNCQNAVIPIADIKAYLNPLSYL
jgi:murein DD-endopeptidase MepM/ murein hydrolase activator NlpD